MTTATDIFLPGSRTEWTSIVRPPDGYRLEAAIGTTYCLDFTALTAILLSCLDQPSEQANLTDDAQLLQAITRLGDRVRVFANRGQLRGDIRPSNKVFALFDEIVCDTRHENGNFHPKVWIFKYSALQPLDTGGNAKKRNDLPGKEALYRILCTSRNLTLTSTWEAAACLEGHTAQLDETNTMGQSVAAFFVTVCGGCPMPKSISGLVKELKRVSFSTKGAKAVQTCEFFWQWPGRNGLIGNLDLDGKTALLVAPFLSVAFLKSLKKRFKNLLIVSRQEQLDNLWSQELANLISLKNIWVVTSASDDADIPSLELHAKLLFCEYAKRPIRPTRTELWLGSANGSPSAWGLLPIGARMNCEAMVRIRPALRPEQFLEQFAYRKSANPGGDRVLNGWIEHYHPNQPDEPDEQERAEKALEDLVEKMAALDLLIRLEPSNPDFTLVLEAAGPEEWTILFAAHTGITFEICPLAIADGHLFQALTELVRGIRFVGLPLAQVGAFLLIRLTHDATQQQKRFVLKARTDMPDRFWDDRRVAFLRENLKPRDFREFLRSILFGGEYRTRSASASQNGTSGKGMESQGRAPTLFDDFSVEDILHACTEDRSRVEEINKLMETFEGTEFVDTGFRQFWSNFCQAIEHKR